MKIAFLIFIATSSILSAQTLKNLPIPTQDDVIKHGALSYFTRLPVEGWERLLHLAHMGTFDLMLNQHKTKPNLSPFRIFNSTANRRQPSDAWSLFMTNDRAEYNEVLTVKYGLCSGLTMVSRKLQMLAHFDPSNKERQNVPNKLNKEAWFNFMKIKLDDMITNNKMVIIPNMHSIEELTSDPLLTNYIKEHIVRQWELVNINVLQGLFQGYAGTIFKMKKETILKNIKTLKSYLALGFNPIVFIPAPNQKIFSNDQWIHTLQVTKITENLNAISLEVWDPNLENPLYSNSINIFPNGEIMFGNKEIGGIYPIQWDTYEIADMIEKNLDFCISRPGFCTTKPKQTTQAILK